MHVLLRSIGVAIFVFNLQVILPDSLKGRCWHSTTITHQTSTKKRLIQFGGLDKVPESTDASTLHPVADTTIAELGEWSVPHSHCFLWYSPHSFWTPDSSVCVVVSTLSVDFSTRKCQHHCTLVFMYTMVYVEPYQSWKLWSSENICPGDKNPPKHQCVVMLASPCTCT